MMNFICSIPEWIGWDLVACVSVVAVVLALDIAKILIQMYYDYLAERAE